MVMDFFDDAFGDSVDDSDIGLKRANDKLENLKRIKNFLTSLISTQKDVLKEMRKLGDRQLIDSLQYYTRSLSTRLGDIDTEIDNTKYQVEQILTSRSRRGITASMRAKHGKKQMKVKMVPRSKVRPYHMNVKIPKLI